MPREWPTKASLCRFREEQFRDMHQLLAAINPPVNKPINDPPDVLRIRR